MAKAKKRPIGQVVDELGDTRSQIAVLQGKEKALKEEILAMRVGEGEGSRFRFVLVSAARSTLDLTKVKLEFGSDWYEARSKTTMTVAVKTTPKIEALANLAAAA